MIVVLCLFGLSVLPYTMGKPINIDIEEIARHLPDPGPNMHYVFVPFGHQFGGITGRSNFGEAQLELAAELRKRRKPCSEKRCKKPIACCPTSSIGGDDDNDDDNDSDIEEDFSDEPVHLNGGGVYQTDGQGNTQTYGVVYVVNTADSVTGGSYSVHGTQNKESHNHKHIQKKKPQTYGSEQHDEYRLDTDKVSESDGDSSEINSEDSSNESDESDENDNDDEESTQDEDSSDDKESSEDTENDSEGTENDSEEEYKSENLQQHVSSQNKNEVKFKFRG